MTTEELREQFPFGCKVRLKKEYLEKGFMRDIGEEEGEVRGHKKEPDVAGKPFLMLRVFVHKQGSHWYQASIWEPVPELGKEQP